MEPEPSRRRVRPAEERAASGRARPNIADIARLANVSTTAVSFALNDRPGLSDQTRDRILSIARQANWQPSRAARAMSTDRAGSIGVITRRRLRQPLWSNNFGAHFLAGVQNELARRDLVLTLHSVPTLSVECEAYRRWLGERRVDGVLVIDPVVDDERIALLADLDLPAVVVGDLRATASALSCVWTDDARATELACGHLAALGHRGVIRIGGPGRLLHSSVRKRALSDIAPRFGLSVSHGSITAREDPEAALRALLAAHPGATAVLVEDLDLAARVIATLGRLGHRVPDDISVLSWDDGDVATLITPTISVLSRDLVGYGTAAASALAELASTGETTRSPGTRTRLVARASTASAPTARASSTGAGVR
ncbi:LacI family DNA-binding transcriptional regulator [Galbitalea sp. SE-J8]|uniref:LacI family DNA-binding transcriptional regulator n=1 Tax=Galbitalea sp. SE-J8 TaxID=3054952 RepID=UPI00259C7E3F|nr:LacI family DNA-binding transcriptional regulator [Galbitalea sp. SE-J8]MDM4762049.1 LacI family DNA-binding transcriptional regulator [Galbitalea sp. SE-J8]